MKTEQDIFKLLNQMPVGTGLFSESNFKNLIFLNDALLYILGLKREDISEHTPVDLHMIPMAGGTTGLVCADSHICPVLINESVMQIGTKTFFCNSFTPIPKDYFPKQTPVLDKKNNENAYSLKTYKMLADVAMQNADLSTWEYDPITHCIYQSEGSQKQHGYEEVIYNVPESLIADGFVHPSCIEEYRALFKEVGKGVERQSGEFRVRKADQTGYWWERLVLTPMYDAQGKYIRAVGTSMNITREKENEFQYKEQLNLLNKANDSDLLAKSLINLTTNNIIQYQLMINTAYQPQDFSDAQAFMHQGIAAACTRPEMREQVIQMFNRERLIKDYHQDRREGARIVQMREPTGDIIWVNATYRLFEDPATNHIMCFIYTYNITMKKNIRDMIDMVVKLDYDYLSFIDCRRGEYIAYKNDIENEKTDSFTAYKNYQLRLAQYAQRCVAKDERESFIQALSIDNLKKELEDKDVFLFYYAAEYDGQQYYKKLQFAYLDRFMKQIIVTCIDVTDIHNNEQKSMEELRKALLTAKKANRAKVDFLSRMSHDLRTPMNAIIGLSNLALEELNNPEAMGDYIANIHSSGKYLLELVNDCLDLNALTGHGIKLHPAPCGFKEFNAGIRTLIEPLCAQKRLNFQIIENGQDYTCCIDKVRYEQIFINLLTNAVKFTPAGGHITLRYDNKLVKDGILYSDIYVEDTGIGMSTDFQSRMFEPFEQKYLNPSLQTQGTGLGLAIVKNLVDLMHGSISVTSQLGQGTSFKISLALRIAAMDAVVEDEKHSMAEVRSRLSNKHVLIVEDHPLNLEITEKLLKRTGMIVSCAENGQECLDLLAVRQDYDVVLMDLHMPVMDGFEACKKIRAADDPYFKQLPILAMTANVLEEDMTASVEAGMNEHLSKPIEPEELYRALDRWIS